MTDTHALPTAFLRRALVGRVRAVFNDRAKGERPVVRSSDALFPRDSVIWRVHGDVTTMMVGGVSALLMQMLHPAALAGIWDHSTFRDDMLGRLRRTARFIAVTTYADRADALTAIERVKDVHIRVTGTLSDGTPYSANEPHLLAWVHVTEALCFLDACIRYGEPDMSTADQDRYFAHAMIMDAAVDLLPAWASTLHGFASKRFTTPIARLSTSVIARTIRWAFAGEIRDPSSQT